MRYLLEATSALSLSFALSAPVQAQDAPDENDLGLAEIIVMAHFDGVHRQDGISNSEFYDLERIEVAPGLQGTLYGRSAAAGAINIIRAKPSDRNEAAGSRTLIAYASAKPCARACIGEMQWP